MVEPGLGSRTCPNLIAVFQGLQGTIPGCSQVDPGAPVLLTSVPRSHSNSGGTPWFTLLFLLFLFAGTRFGIFRP